MRVSIETDQTTLHTAMVDQNINSFFQLNKKLKIIGRGNIFDQNRSSFKEKFAKKRNEENSYYLSFPCLQEPEGYVVDFFN